MPLGSDPRLRWPLRAALASISLAVSTGCGGGLPLLHPVHPLPKGEVSASAGVSQRFALGEAADAMEDGARATADGVTPEEDRVTLAGALAESVTAPGLAPYSAARVGLGRATEAGVTASTRVVRLDTRRAFGGDTTALSLGLALAGRAGPRGGPAQLDGTIPGVDSHRLAALALEAPLVVGYRSSANVVSLWAGVRPGFELAGGPVRVGTGDGTGYTTTLRARRATLEGLVGAMVGVAPLWIALELDVGYHHGSGRWDASTDPDGAVPRTGGSVSVDGLSLTPAAVLVGRLP